MKVIDKIKTALSGPTPGPLTVAGTQTTLAYRSFNPAVDQCSDPANAIIYQNSPNFPEGMYQCVSGVYTPLTVGPASRLIGAKLTSSVGISVPDSGAAAVPFNQELFDSDTLHDNVVNNSRLVCKFPGIYILGGLLDFSANATGIRAIFIRLNGVSTLQLANFVPVAASPYTGNTVTQVTGIFNLALNDYVELMGGQTSGLALNTAAGPPATPQFWMIKVA